MDVRSFCEELFCFFPIQGSQEEKARRVDSYEAVISEKITEMKCRYNYHKLLRHLQKKFDKMPSVKSILEDISVGAVIESRLSGDEGKVIKRTVNGHEYEFVIVPNTWDRVMTVNELDNSVKRRIRDYDTDTEGF